MIDFEMFRPELEGNMLNHDKKSNAGCKPYDVVMMFKIILLKRFYNLSDEQAEYQITDRLSFKEFLGLSSGDRVPDARSIEQTYRYLRSYERGSTRQPADRKVTQGGRQLSC